MDMPVLLTSAEDDCLRWISLPFMLLLRDSCPLLLWPWLWPIGVPATWAKNWMTFFVFSVLPAPDSPLQNSNDTGTMLVW